MVDENWHCYKNEDRNEVTTVTSDGGILFSTQRTFGIENFFKANSEFV